VYLSTAEGDNIASHGDIVEDTANGTWWSDIVNEQWRKNLKHAVDDEYTGAPL